MQFDIIRVHCWRCIFNYHFHWVSIPLYRPSHQFRQSTNSNTFNTFNCFLFSASSLRAAFGFVVFAFNFSINSIVPRNHFKIILNGRNSILFAHLFCSTHVHPFAVLNHLNIICAWKKCNSEMNKQQKATKNTSDRVGASVRCIDKHTHKNKYHEFGHLNYFIRSIPTMFYTPSFIHSNIIQFNCNLFPFDWFVLSVLSRIIPFVVWCTFRLHAANMNTNNAHELVLNPVRI